MARSRYRRTEDEATKRFYGVHAEPYDLLPDDLEALVGRLAARTGLPRDAAEYPVGRDALAAAAAALAEEGLDPADPDPAHVDHWVNGRLVDACVRDLFAGGAALGADGQAQLAALRGRLRAPHEPLLAYALGAYWGEWLCRNAGATWHLHAPLRPLQSFPDAIQLGTVVCALPFSHVMKKIADPEVDALADKREFLARRTVFLPVALMASLADGERVRDDLMPAAVAEAEAMLLAGARTDDAFTLLADAVRHDADNGHLLHRVEQLAWQHEQYPLVHHCASRQAKLAPHDPRILHNFAVIESMREGGLANAIGVLLSALEIDSRYARARITLASCLRQSGRADEAREHARYVADTDPELADEARELLAELDADP